LQSAHSGLAENQAASAVGNAVYEGNQLGHGRLDVYQAVQAWLLANGVH
jgi:hypothetical protein